MYDLNVADVARKLGLSEDHIRRLAALGTLPAVRVGQLGHWRFSAEEIEAYLRTSRLVPTQPVLAAPVLSTLGHGLPLA